MRAAPLILLLAGLPAAAGEPPLDDDFEEDRPATSIALGPVPSGRPFAFAEVGWLRSGLGFRIGFGGRVDFTIRADTMLLYDGFSGQSGLHAGVRWSPVVERALRISIEASAGQVLLPVGEGLETGTAVQGELSVGTTFPFATLYGRVALRGMGGTDIPDRPRFLPEWEAGLGVERVWRRLVFGAEAFTLGREGHNGLGEWRLRVGLAI